MNKLNICLVGLGTVGLGVYEILKGNYLIKNTALLYAVCDKDQTKKDKFDDVIFYSDIENVINDDKIDVVVEMIGGEKIAYRLIKESLLKGKNVVTSNKEVVALHLHEFMTLSKEKNVSFLFEASVGGGVPIISSLQNYSMVNEINKVKGIINGSTNFLLTKVQEKKPFKMSYKEALEEAYNKGFLEKDPKADLKGLDMIRKIAILSSLAYHTFVDIDKIYSYSLENVDDDYIDFVNRLGYVLKYMCESEKRDEKILIRVEPVLIKKDNIISKVVNEVNYITFTGDKIDDLVFLGKGAGKNATATAVTSDILMIVENRGKIYYQNINTFNVCGNDDFIDQYIIKEKEDCKIKEEIISKKENGYIITKKITGRKLKEEIDNISFYARIEND